MTARKWMWVMWPAFLVAGLLEMVVFAMVDPQDMHLFGGPVPSSRLGVYTLMFFVFWGFAMLSSGLTALLSIPPWEINRESDVEF